MSQITHSGGISAPKQTPQQFTYTGVMEFTDVVGSPGYTQINLPDLNPGMVRILRKEENPIATTITRSNQITNAGVTLLPCIRTDGFSSLASFQSYLNQWIDGVDPAVLWWEIGNEPYTVLPGDTDTNANRRKKFLTYLAAASAILDANGKKLIMSAITGAAGGTAAVLDDIHGGGAQAGGTTFSMIDGVAIHPYSQQAVQQPAGTPFNNNNVHDSVAGFRNRYDTATGTGYTGELAGKPMWITEVGFSCATRVNGSGNPGDWAPGQPGFTNGATGQQNRVIPLTTTGGVLGQAELLTQCFNGLIPTRFSSQNNLMAIIWFCHIDYNLPAGNWDHHCGLIDANLAKRPSYGALKGLPRALALS